MEFSAVVVYAVTFCLYIGFQDCLLEGCLSAGIECQTANECCNGVLCKKPPHTCGGICNNASCSGNGTNRPLGMQCDGDNSQCAPNMDGSVVFCHRPPAKTCDGICPECNAVPY